MFASQSYHEMQSFLFFRPLPHVKCRGFKPEGNPVYARDMLIFPNDPDNCKLGNVGSLASA